MDYQKLFLLFDDCLTAHYHHFEEDASFSVRRDNNTVTVFFEKSNGATDWRNNLRFSARPYRDMQEPWYCHRGFLKVFRAALVHLESIFLDESVKAFRLVGYSHGAALALLSHEYILFHRPELSGNVEGYGFGCPRVIFGCIPKGLQKRLRGFTVIRNGRDIVTHLPPRLLGYTHPSAPLTIGEGGGYGMIDAHRSENYRAELLKRSAIGTEEIRKSGGIR